MADVISQTLFKLQNKLEVRKITIPETKRIVYCMNILENIVSDITINLCQKYTKEILSKNQKCALYIDCKSIVIASPKIIKKQVEFLQEINARYSQGNSTVEKIGFVAGPLTGSVLKKIMDDEDSVPYKIFKDEEKAWSYVCE